MGEWVSPHLRRPLRLHSYLRVKEPLALLLFGNGLCPCLCFLAVWVSGQWSLCIYKSFSWLLNIGLCVTQTGYLAKDNETGPSPTLSLFLIGTTLQRTISDWESISPFSALFASLNFLLTFMRCTSIKGPHFDCVTYLYFPVYAGQIAQFTSKVFFNLGALFQRIILTLLKIMTLIYMLEEEVMCYCLMERIHCPPSWHCLYKVWHFSRDLSGLQPITTI